MNTRERLIQAIENGEVLNIVYHGGPQPGTVRPLLPIGIVGSHLRAVAPPAEDVYPYHVNKMEIVTPGHSAPAYDPARTPSRLSASPAPRPPAPARAIPGSYDDAYFIDPRTRAFRFPRFSSPDDALVSVRDRTRPEHTALTSPQEAVTPNDGIRRFEDEFVAARFEVEDIGCLLQPSNAQHFEPFPYLAKARAQVDALVACMEDTRRNPYVVADNRIYSLLESDGFAQTVALGRNQAIARWRDLFHEDELARIASKAGIDGHGDKDILIARLARSGVLSPPSAVRPTERFDSLIVALVDVYITEIRRISDSFHPLCIPDVWKATAQANRNGWSYLESRIQEVQEENYWLARFESGSPWDPGEPLHERWWTRW